MIILRTLASLVLGSILLACAAGAPTPTPDLSSLVITLERTPCFGFCPVYRVTVYGDGRVVYEGQDFVAVTGQQTSRLTPAQVQDLISAYEEAGYFSLQDNYTAQVTDLPSTITAVSIGGQTKTIVNYGGCMAEPFAGSDLAPAALCEFESLIDSVTNSTQWVGQP